MRVLAVGDVHGKEYLDPFRAALEAAKAADLFLLAGDLTDHNHIDEFGEVIAAVRDHHPATVVCVFGNNEWTSDHEKYRKRFEHVVFLDDEAHSLNIGGKKIRIIGSTGSLDEPTWWQRNNVPGIATEYQNRIRKLDDLLAGSDFRVLLTHYPPTFATMGAEKEAWRPQLGSRRLEKVVLRRRPNLVVHGHVHKGIPSAILREDQPTLDAYADEREPIPVYNVAFPVTKTVTTLPFPGEFLSTTRP